MSLALTTLPRPDQHGYFASHWRSLDYFNLYRLTLALALVFAGTLFGSSEFFSEGASERFLAYAYVYLICAALFVLGIRARWPGFQIQLTAHITADVFFTVLLMSTNAQLAVGLGLMLAVSVASGGLVGSGRLTLLYAAVASIALLLQHTFAWLGGGRGTESFFQVGLLCAGYFAIGWLAHALTERASRSERLAQEQAAKLALLDRINALAVENSPEGLLAINAAGVVKHMTPRALELLGLPPGSSPLGKPLTDCVPTLAAALPAQGEPGIVREVLLPNARLRMRSIPTAASDDTRIVMLEDPTQAEQAAQRLKLAALGRLTANIAHEIRNPLAAISQAAQLLREDAADTSSARLAGIVENNARRLDRLVEEVLTLNRRDRIRPTHFDVATLTTLLDELREAEEIPAAAVIVDMPGTLHFAFDSDHLRQILWNLLRNAWRHASRRASCLHIQGRTLDGEVQLDLLDDGPGVTPEQRSKLFEPFFTTDAQGTGLGLFLARELAEANHATLNYLPGSAGACFRLSLAYGD